MKYIYKLRESTKFQMLLYWLVIAFSFAYVFSIPAFSYRAKLNLISYCLIACLGIFVFIFTFLYSKFSLRKELLFIPLFAIFGFLGTAIYSHDFRMWISIVLMSVTFLIFYFTFRIIKKPRIALEILCNAITLFSLYFIASYSKSFLGFITGHADRLGNKFGNVNAISAICAIGFASSLYLLCFLKHKIKYLHLINLGTISLVGISTMSRTFIIAIIVFLLVFLFAKYKNKKLIFLFILVFITVFFIVLLSMPFMDGIRTRLLNAFKTLDGTADKADTSVLQRSAWLIYGFYLGMKNLLIGYGANGFSVISGVGTYAHSNFSEVICDFGLIGLLLFYLPIIVCTIRCIVKKNPNSFFVFGFFAYYFAISFSNVFYYNKNYYIILALIFYLTFDYENVVVPVKRVLLVCDNLNEQKNNNEFYKMVKQLSASRTDIKFSFYILDSKSCCSADELIERKNTTLRNYSYLSAVKKVKPEVVIATSSFSSKIMIKGLFFSNAKRLWFVQNSSDFYNEKSRFLRNALCYFIDGFIFISKSVFSSPIHKKGDRCIRLSKKEIDENADFFLHFLGKIKNNDISL